MIVTLAAWLFLIASVAIAILHAVLMCGAPIGYMTMGGRNPGVLPFSARVSSLVQGVLILSFALIVLNVADVIEVPGVPSDRWFMWVIVAVSALSLLANAITPSKRERLFGVPAALALLIGSLVVAVGG